MGWGKESNSALNLNFFWFQSVCANTPCNAHCVSGPVLYCSGQEIWDTSSAVNVKVACVDATFSLVYRPVSLLDTQGVLWMWCWFLSFGTKYFIAGIVLCFKAEKCHLASCKAPTPDGLWRKSHVPPHALLVPCGSFRFWFPKGQRQGCVPDPRIQATGQAEGRSRNSFEVVELLPSSWVEPSGGCSVPWSCRCLPEKDLIPAAPCSAATPVPLQCSLLPLQSSGLSLALNSLRMTGTHRKPHYRLPFLKAKTHARRAWSLWLPVRAVNQNVCHVLCELLHSLCIYLFNICRTAWLG